MITIAGESFKSAIFIELKGIGLSQALKQLYSTIIYLKQGFSDHRIEARIVGSRDVPGFTNIPDYKKLFKEVK